MAQCKSCDFPIAEDREYCCQGCEDTHLRARVNELEAEVKRLHDKYDFQLLVKQNAKLRKVVDAARDCLWIDECHCDLAYTLRGRHAPNKRCGELDPIRDALRELDGEKTCEHQFKYWGECMDCGKK